MAGTEQESLMRKSIKILLLFLLVVLFACGLSIWAEYSPAVFDYKLIHNRDTNDNVLFAFATALRVNHPAAYDMIDPGLKPQLDDWMDTHQTQRCKDIPYFFMSESGTKTGHKVILECFGYDGRIEFVVDNIIIKDMKVIRWGE
jgi:hypothetical protein